MLLYSTIAEQSNKLEKVEHSDMEKIPSNYYSGYAVENKMISSPKRLKIDSKTATSSGGNFCS